MPDREKVINALGRCESYGYCEDTGCPYYENTSCLELLRKDALALLKEQEAVVRCKDCMHGYRCKNAAGEDSVECTNHYVSLDSICRKPDWFCADGERK